MNFGGGSQQPVTQQTTQNKDPWGPAQPLLKDVLARASGYLGENTGYNPYTGPVQADLSAQTQSGLQGVLNQDVPDINQRYSADAATRMLANEGMTGNLNQQVAQYNALYGDANTYANDQIGKYSNLYNQAAQLAQQPASQYGDLYNKYATAFNDPINKFGNVYNSAIGYADQAANNYNQLYNEMSGTQNPYLLSYIDTNNRKIGDKINASMSGAGRYGSGQHTDVMSRALAEAADPILAQDLQFRQQQRANVTNLANQAYNQAQQTQLGAAGGMGNLIGAGLSGQMNATQGLNNIYNNMLSQQQAAAGGLSNTYNSLFQNRMNATGANAGLFNQGLARQSQWAGMAPNIWESGFDPYEKLLDVGGFYDQRAQADLDNQIRLYNAQQAYPWEQLFRANAAAGGAGGLGGTNVTNTPIGQQPSLAQRILGGSLAGAGIGGSFGGLPGAGIGALGGGLLGLF